MGKFFLERRIKSNPAFTEFGKFSSLKNDLRLILIKKYEKTYCSLDQFLCAMGALI
jgi:hypothetical protein